MAAMRRNGTGTANALKSIKVVGNFFSLPDWKMVYEFETSASLAQPKTIPGRKISQLQMCMIRHDSKMISETCRTCGHGCGFQRVPIGLLVPCTSTLSGSELKPFETFKPSFKPND